MNRKKILYVSSNDGSDMRINKEIKSLSKYADVYFLGVGKTAEKCFVKRYTIDTFLLIGNRRSLWVMLKQVFWFIKLSRKYKFDSYHFVNEQLMLQYYPFLFGKHVVLDLFDSLFLILNKSGEKWGLIKRLTYAPINEIFVTDEARLNLQPKFTRKKTNVLPNYANRLFLSDSKIISEKVVILYFGWMSDDRGTPMLRKLVEMYPEKIKIIMAGWFSDDSSREFSIHPSVDYRGIITQEAALEIASKEASYIMCTYRPTNESMRNASPNKVFDAIQAKTPVIMNSDVIMSSWIEENGLGLVIGNYDNLDMDEVAMELITKKDSFIFNDKIADQYSWEAVENVLFKSHNLI